MACSTFPSGEIKFTNQELSLNNKAIWSLNTGESAFIVKAQTLYPQTLHPKQYI